MYLAAEVLLGQGTRRLPAAEAAVSELDVVYAFIYTRVGNPSDAEDLTQEVALKALPRLREGTPAPAVRSYLFATARSVLAAFWSRRLRLPESELPEELRAPAESTAIETSAVSAARVRQILDGLQPDHRQVLELRFLRGYSTREVARQMGKTVGSVKVMQLRALRKAAQMAPT
ncbi:MAG TPA: sigma-70 family RNA polymerase sigma factor [Candidatus Dormibacteraeota bacterium]|nr:sigma-70 family RNA polymerase sigma factor [Candidatus Dormibacteraeota bacterium]